MNNKTLLLSMLAAGAALIAVPAHATHPWQDCAVDVDVAALARANGVVGAKYATIRFSYDRSSSGFGGAPASPVFLELLGDGSATPFKRTITTDLYERSLTGITIEFRTGSSDSPPAASVSIEAVEGVDADPVHDAKDAREKTPTPLVCTTRAS